MANANGVLTWLHIGDLHMAGVGETHYNEIANDGRTIFLATRSTGQIGEGPPGFSTACVDGRDVSWRFKPLDRAWPCVLIIRPVDRRLATDPRRPAADISTVRAKVLGDSPIDVVEVRMDDGDWVPMTPFPGGVGLWETTVANGGTRIAVRVRDAKGRSDEDRIEPSMPGWTPPVRVADGSDRDRIGAWAEKSIFDTQLGPNRNGRHW